LETGSVVDKMRSGKPPVISPQCSRAIKRICQRNRLLSVSNITVIYNTVTLRHVSVSTVQKILKMYRLRSYTEPQKPFLTLSQRRERRTWAKSYGTWDTNKWKAIVFTDECVIQSYLSPRKVRIRRTSNEKYNNTLTQPVMRHGPKIHVCGCFTSQGVGLLKEFMVI